MDFKNFVSLAPMAGITDIAFRSLCVNAGAKMTVSELTSAEGIIRNQENSFKQLERSDNENNFAIQLFGHDSNSMSKAAAMVEKQCNIIDVNMGCPVRKVMNTGAGCSLLNNPKQAANIIKSIVDSTSIPISFKIRLGINKPNKAVALAKACEKAGASFVTVHGRTQTQMYGGVANWNAIKEVADAVSIPVIGNGDVNSPEIAKKRINEDNIAGVAIGRASSGNPYLFTQINDFLNKGQYKPLTNQIRLKLFKEYLDLAKKYNIPFLNQKLQAQHVTKGNHGASKIRLLLNNTKTPSELLETIKIILN